MAAARRDDMCEPLGLIDGPAASSFLAAGTARPFQGGPLAFLHPAGPVPATLTAPLAPFAGLPVTAGRPLVMGIVNVTPDSFSGDGIGTAAAIAEARALRAAGADILDIGGESTRPGAEPVPPAEEQRRILPVIEALAAEAPVSVDTRNAATMAAALAAGARIVNDVSALLHDPAAPEVVARAGCAVVVMHMATLDPRTMQAHARYRDVAAEVAAFLAARVAALTERGIPRGRIAVDPGIGFGKTVVHNLALLERLPILGLIGCPILVGASRKGFLGRLSGIAEAGRRAVPSVAAALLAASRGAAILRVHDVAETVQALRVWQAAVTVDAGGAGE